MATENATTQAGERTLTEYKGFVLYSTNGEGEYWVSGEEKWMTLEEIDELVKEREIEESYNY